MASYASVHANSDYLDNIMDPRPAPNNFNLNTLDRRFSYSFVLQHPVNRIVTPTSMPMIYLIKVYEIVHNVDLNTNVTINELNLQNFISLIF